MTAPHYHSHVDDPVAVGRRLKDARLAAGLSQRQLSFPGCSAAYISRLEAGDRVPSLQLLRKLAAKLNADEQYLATGVEQIQQPPPELIEAEVERRLSGERPDSGAGEERPANGLEDPASRARALWALLAPARGQRRAQPRGGLRPRRARAARLRGRSERQRVASRQWSTVRSAAAASTCPASSSAAATSAESARRRPSSAPGESEDEAHALLDAAWEAGITTYDTADAYGGGRSESYLGSWLRAQGAEVRERIVLTTKTFNPMSEGADSGLAPARIRRQLATSLARLGVDAVDLYLPHAMDEANPDRGDRRRLRGARR